MKKSSSFRFVVVLLALSAFVAAVNFFSFNHYFRWDKTKEGLYSLSEQTLKMVRSIREPVSVKCFYQGAHPHAKQVRDFLKEFDQARNPRLTVEYLDPDKDRARVQALAQQYRFKALNTIVVQSGGKTKQLSDGDLFKVKPVSAGTEEAAKVEIFKGEEALVNALLNVLQKKQKSVYFLAGHGEKDAGAADQNGILVLKSFLKKNNMRSDQLVLFGKTSVPDDADLIVVPGPVKPFQKSELELLQKYVEEGGRLLLLIDPLTQPGLEPLLGEWGVNSENKVVVDPASGLPNVSAANLFAANYSSHPVVKEMSRLAVLFVLTRPVLALPSGENAPWNAIPIIFTTPAGWGESQITSQRYQFDPESDIKGPVSVGVAVEPGADSAYKGRAVVLGDSEFVTNTQLENVGNSDLVAGALRWLLEEEKLVSIPSKKKRELQLHLNKKEMRQMVWVSMAGLPLMSLGFGAIVWLRRRQ